MAKGKALDITQAAPVFGFHAKVTGTSDYAQIQGSDVVVVTAGLARKPGMSRLDLLLKNAEIIKGISRNIVDHAPESIVIVVTNPVDVMTYHLWNVSGLPSHRVIGQAGILDSSRYSAFLAESLQCSVKDITPLVLGGHGDEMVPLPGYTTVCGVPVNKLLPEDHLATLGTRTQKGGAEIVELLQTGSAYYAPAASTYAMVEAVIHDSGRVLPCSVLLTGEYGLKDVCVGVPVKLGAKGIREILEIPLSPADQAALTASAAVYRNSIDQLK
jgi:malate dehydrogenase